ncbi:hypothetical protein HID58_048733 [Brassica napus]|uniref:Uncharacterized protein n=1 Tax=Brassica napus TaxID=3708 RepID=A0ABQ8B301_BRANA|nr:hypothetical protein HID58_048733 [Brassica napus]
MILFKDTSKVLYGADLETEVFGSRFHKISCSQEASSSDEKYAKSGCNLNNFSRLPGSLLKHEGSDISGVLVSLVVSDAIYRARALSGGEGHGRETKHDPIRFQVSTFPVVNL